MNGNDGADNGDWAGWQYPDTSQYPQNGNPVTYAGNDASTINAMGVYIYVDPTWRFTLPGSNNALNFPGVWGPNYLEFGVTVEYGTAYGGSDFSSYGGQSGDPVLTIEDGNGDGGVIDLDTSSGPAPVGGGTQYLSNGAGVPGWVYVQEQVENGYVYVWLWDYATNQFVEAYSAPQSSISATYGMNVLSYVLPQNYSCPTDPSGNAVGAFNYFVGEANASGQGVWGWVLPQPSNTSEVDAWGPNQITGCFGSTADYAGFPATWYSWYGGILQFSSSASDPTVVATASNPNSSSGSTTTLSFSSSFPNGACPNGDIIVVGIGYNGGSATGFSFSGGGAWNAVRAPMSNASTGYDTYAAYWHPCGSSEPTSYTITASGSPLSNNNFNYVAVAIAGANATSPINQYPTNLGYGSSTTTVYNTLASCSAVNCLPVVIGFNGNDYSAPTCDGENPITEVSSNDGSGPGMTLCAAGLTQSIPGGQVAISQSRADFLAVDAMMIAPAGTVATPTPSPASPTLVRRTACASNSTQNLSCTLTSAISTGDVGIVTAAVYNGGTASISSITNATIIDNVGTSNDLASAWVGAGVSSVIVNTSAAGSYVYVEVDEYSGVNTTTPVDQHIAPDAVADGTTCTPSPLTPSQAGDLAVEYAANFTNSASPVQGIYSTSPSTIMAIEGNSSGGILALEGWSDDNGSSAITGTWTWNTPQEEQCGFLLLNPASASPTPSPTSSSTAPPPPNVLSHVMTAAVCCENTYDGDPVSNVSLLAPYLSWDNAPSATDAQAVYQACTPEPCIKSYDYLDFGIVSLNNTPNSIDYYGVVGTGSASNPNGTYASAAAINSACNEGVITYTYSANNVGVMLDPRQSATLNLINYVLPNDGSFQYYSAWFFDDTGDWWTIGMPCDGTGSALDADWGTVFGEVEVGGTTQPIIFNGLTESAPFYSGAPASEYKDSLNALSASNVIGAMGESFYGRDGPDAINEDDQTPCSETTDSECAWSDMENIQIGVQNLGKMVWVYNMIGDSDQNDNLSWRAYTYASFMLTWVPNLSVYQTKYNQSGTTLRVTPETGLTAYNALYTQQVTDISQLRKSGGVYVREYQSCYFRGASIGGCAFLVNPISSGNPPPLPSLAQSYTHALVLDSAMVLEGGTVHCTGPVPSSLSPGSAVILVTTSCTLP